MLGTRLQCRLSVNTTEWESAGVVEGSVDGGVVLRIALTAAGRKIWRALCDRYDISQEYVTRDGLVRISASLVEVSPFLRLVDIGHFDLDTPMGPGVGEYHDRPTTKIQPGRGRSDAPL